MRAISVRLPEKLLEALDKEAARQRRTRSQMIVFLLSEKLEKKKASSS